jgi:hypothetical protein
MLRFPLILNQQLVGRPVRSIYPGRFHFSVIAATFVSPELSGAVTVTM